MFVEATEPTNQRNVFGDFYFFADLNVKLKLHKSMFTNPRQILRVRFETALISDKTIRIDINSYIGQNKKINIHNAMMCKPPDQLEVDLPILQEQLNLNFDAQGEILTRIELRAVRSQMGIKSVTFSIEQQREPFTGSLATIRPSSVFSLSSDFSTTNLESWAGNIIG